MEVILSWSEEVSIWESWELLAVVSAMTEVVDLATTGWDAGRREAVALTSLAERAELVSTAESFGTDMVDRRRLCRSDMTTGRGATSGGGSVGLSGNSVRGRG